MIEETTITEMTPLIIHQVNTFLPPQYLRDDYIQAGRIGLLKAIRTFNPNLNTKLSTYAVKCITNEILKFIQQEKKQKMICRETLRNVPDFSIDEYLPSTITEVDKQILQYKIYYKYTFMEIGKIFQRTKQWAYQRYHGAIKILRENQVRNLECVN